MIKKILLVIMCCIRAGYIFSQEELSEPNSPLLLHIFQNCSPRFFDILSQPEKYKYQIVYTRIDRNKNGYPKLTNHFFNYDKRQYLYPASLVKLPLSVLALQKIQSLQKYGVTLSSPMITDSGYWCQTRMLSDPTQPGGMPTLEGYIKKMMLVSDNEAYNRTYEFLGYDYLCRQMQSHNYPDMRIIQRYEQPCDSLSHYITNPIYFLNEKKDTLYKQNTLFGECRLRNPNGEVWMGSSYYDNSGYLFPFSRSFIFNNFAPLAEEQLFLASVFTPEGLKKTQRWDISEENLNVLRKYMGQWPRESTNPSYALPDNFKKYILMGDGSRLPDSSDIRIFNVVGRAFGVVGDCAYVVDFKNNIEFYVTAIVYCNDDDVLNDDVYEYNTVGLPFLAELGRLLYDYERGRPKEFIWHNSELEKLYKK